MNAAVFVNAVVKNLRSFLNQKKEFREEYNNIRQQRYSAFGLKLNGSFDGKWNYFPGS